MDTGGGDGHGGRGLPRGEGMATGARSGKGCDERGVGVCAGTGTAGRGRGWPRGEEGMDTGVRSGKGCDDGGAVEMKRSVGRDWRGVRRRI